MKNLSVGVFVLFTIISCNTDDKSVDYEQKKKGYAINQDTKSLMFNYDSEQERESVLSEISNQYLQAIYLEDQIDTRYQVSGAIIQENKEEKTLRLVYETVNLGNMNDEELMLFMMSYPIDYNEVKLQTERLEHYCDGGSKNGSSITLDRPNGPRSAYKYAQQVAKFAQACLDGGGCLQICNAYVVLLPNNEELNFSSEIYKEEYEELVDISKFALFTLLEAKVSE